MRLNETFDIPECHHIDARMIASDWHNGMACPLYALASTGYIGDNNGNGIPVYSNETVKTIQALVTHCNRNDNQTEARRLGRLVRYVQERIRKNQTGIVSDWTSLHW